MGLKTRVLVLVITVACLRYCVHCQSPFFPANQQDMVRRGQLITSLPGAAGSPRSGFSFMPSSAGYGRGYSPSGFGSYSSPRGYSSSQPRGYSSSQPRGYSSTSSAPGRAGLSARFGTGLSSPSTLSLLDNQQDYVNSRAAGGGSRSFQTLPSVGVSREESYPSLARSHPFSSIRLNPVPTSKGVSLSRPQEDRFDRGRDRFSSLFDSENARKYSLDAPSTFEKPIAKTTLPDVHSPIELDLADDERERVAYAKRQGQLPPSRGLNGDEGEDRPRLQAPTLGLRSRLSPAGGNGGLLGWERPSSLPPMPGHSSPTTTHFSDDPEVRGQRGVVPRGGGGRDGGGEEDDRQPPRFDDTAPFADTPSLPVSRSTQPGREPVSADQPSSPSPQSPPSSPSSSPTVYPRSRSSPEAKETITAGEGQGSTSDSGRAESSPAELKDPAPAGRPQPLESLTGPLSSALPLGPSTDSDPADPNERNLPDVTYLGDDPASSDEGILSYGPEASENLAPDSLDTPPSDQPLPNSPQEYPDSLGIAGETADDGTSSLESPKFSTDITDTVDDVAEKVDEAVDTMKARSKNRSLLDHELELPQPAGDPLGVLSTLPVDPSRLADLHTDGSGADPTEDVGLPRLDDKTRDVDLGTILNTAHKATGMRVVPEVVRDSSSSFATSEDDGLSDAERQQGLTSSASATDYSPDGVFGIADGSDVGKEVDGTNTNPASDVTGIGPADITDNLSDDVISNRYADVIDDKYPADVIDNQSSHSLEPDSTGGYDGGPLPGQEYGQAGDTADGSLGLHEHGPSVENDSILPDRHAVPFDSGVPKSDDGDVISDDNEGYPFKLDHEYLTPTSSGDETVTSPHHPPSLTSDAGDRPGVNVTTQDLPTNQPLPSALGGSDGKNPSPPGSDQEKAATVQNEYTPYQQHPQQDELLSFEGDNIQPATTTNRGGSRRSSPEIAENIAGSQSGSSQSPSSPFEMMFGKSLQDAYHQTFGTLFGNLNRPPASPGAFFSGGGGGGGGGGNKGGGGRSSNFFGSQPGPSFSAGFGQTQDGPQDFGYDSGPPSLFDNDVNGIVNKRPSLRLFSEGK